MQLIINKKQNIKINFEQNEIIKQPIKSLKLAYQLLKILFREHKKIKNIKFLQIEGTINEFLVLTNKIIEGVD